MEKYGQNGWEDHITVLRNIRDERLNTYLGNFYEYIAISLVAFPRGWTLKLLVGGCRILCILGLANYNRYCCTCLRNRGLQRSLAGGRRHGSPLLLADRRGPIWSISRLIYYDRNFWMPKPACVLIDSHSKDSQWHEGGDNNAYSNNGAP